MTSNKTCFLKKDRHGYDIQNGSSLQQKFTLETLECAKYEQMTRKNIEKIISIEHLVVVSK